MRRFLAATATVSATLAATGLILGTSLHADPIVSPEASPTFQASRAINLLGLDLYRQITGTGQGGNLVLSPYSIQTALAMTYAGAAGKTRSEMARVLHFEGDETTLHSSFQALAQSLALSATHSNGNFSFNVANRLFGHSGFEFEKPFLQTVATFHGAPLEPIDFARSAVATRHINGWVEDQTRKRIQNLIPDGLLSGDTRLVLVNAMHLKAAWQKEFASHRTQPEAFHLTVGTQANVSTMHDVGSFGFRQFTGFRAVSLAYRGTDLQMLLLVPDAVDGLAATRTGLTSEILDACRHLQPTEVDLAIPRFKLSPPSIQLASNLRALGLLSAFDVHRGSADFSRMAHPSKDQLMISEVVHKTFLEVDEKGTEAAAATAVIMMRTAAIPTQKPKPIIVRVDRPFLLAIQHKTSGACLFLGQITDPR